MPSNDPQVIARLITKQCNSQTAQAGAGVTYGICPSCTRIHKLTAQGAVVRHGWKAKNVRHGQHQGFHIGGHGSLAPIGTVVGNKAAQEYAASHHQTADHMAAQADPTIEDATTDCIQFINDSRARLWQINRRGDRPVVFRELSEVQAWSGWLGYSGWFTTSALEHKAKSILQARQEAIAAHRLHAEVLDALVAQNPAQ